MELVLLDVLLERVQALGLLKQRGKQRTDSTHVLAAVRAMNRLERVPPLAAECRPPQM
jgi:transposase